MKHAFFLALQYLKSAPLRTTLLIFGLGIAMFLPLFSFLTADLIEQKLMERANASPILIGYKGDQFDLTMNALYFRGKVQDPLQMKTQLELEQSDYGVAVPLYVRHTVSQTPVVGTSLEYFSQRGHRLDDGRSFAVLGEVVIGAKVAHDFQLEIGDTVRSDVQNLYNIAGAYPMTMRVVGILEESFSIDDEVFFVSMQTAWALDGLLHGHQAVDAQTALNPQAKEDENLEATAAIFLFPEITEENRKTFHMHGDVSQMPLGAVLVFPHDQQSHDIILGDYALSKTLQAVRPKKVVQNILEIVLAIRDGLLLYFFVICISTLSLLLLVFSLSKQLRSEEFVLIRRIGGSARVIRKMIFAELIVVFFFSFIFSLLLNVGLLGFLRVLLNT